MVDLTDDRDRFERWATILLAIVAALMILVALILVPNLNGTPAVNFFVLVQATVAVALTGIAAWGLREGEPWARPFAVVLLVMFVIEGALASMGSLLRSSINIPVLAIAALIVLVQPRGPIIPVPLLTRDRSILTILVAILVGAWIWGAIAGPFLV